MNQLLRYFPVFLLCAGVSWAQGVEWSKENPGPETALWRLVAGESEPVALEVGVSHPGGPAWMPDGKRLLFHGYNGRDWDIFSCQPDGTDVQPVITGASDDFAPAVSPDGKYLAYSSDADGAGAYVVVYDIAAKESRRLSEPIGDYRYHQDAAWSPDGTRIAFTAYVGLHDPPQVYVIPAEGGTAERVSRPEEGAAWPVWTADGAALLYAVVSENSEEAQLVRKPMQPPRPAELLNVEAPGPISSGVALGPGEHEMTASHIIPGQGRRSGLLRLNIQERVAEVLAAPKGGGGLSGFRDPSWSPDGALLSFTSYEAPAYALAQRLHWRDFLKSAIAFRDRKLTQCVLGHRGELIFSRYAQVAPEELVLYVFEEGESLELRHGYLSTEVFARVESSGEIRLLNASAACPTGMYSDKWPRTQMGALVKAPANGTVLLAADERIALEPPQRPTAGWLYRVGEDRLCGAEEAMRPFPGILWVLRGKEGGLEIWSSVPGEQAPLLLVQPSGKVVYGSAAGKEKAGLAAGRWGYVDNNSRPMMIPPAQSWRLQSTHLPAIVYPNGAVLESNERTYEYVAPETVEEFRRILRGEGG